MDSGPKGSAVYLVRSKCLDLSYRISRHFKRLTSAEYFPTNFSVPSVALCFKTSTRVAKIDLLSRYCRGERKHGGTENTEQEGGVVLFKDVIVCGRVFVRSSRFRD